MWGVFHGAGIDIAGAAGFSLVGGHSRALSIIALSPLNSQSIAVCVSRQVSSWRRGKQNSVPSDPRNILGREPMSVLKRRADNICSCCVFLSLTRSGHS